MAAQLSYADILRQVKQLSVEEQARLIQEVRERLQGFGMWQDRTDMVDPELCVQRLREEDSKRPDGTLQNSRRIFSRDGSVG